MLSGYGLFIAVSLLAIMISAGAIAFAIGIATGNRRLQEAGKEELNQCLINGLLISGFAVLFLPSGIMQSVIGSLTSGTSSSCPTYMLANPAICFAQGYLSGSGYTFGSAHYQSVLSQSSELILGLLSLNTVLGLLASLKITILIATIDLSSVLYPVISQVQFFIKALSTVSIGALVQSSILSAISVCATTAILPTGLILRTFYPTRQLGGFLIATSIGLYVVFPLTYVLDASIISSYQQGISNSSLSSLSSSASGLDSYVSGISARTNSTTAFLSGISSYLSQISADASSLISALSNYLSYLILATFILPAFSIVLTSISVKELSAILGSEITFNMFDVI